MQPWTGARGAGAIVHRGPDRPHPLAVLLPICQPHDLSTLTTLGVTAAVRGTRMKMKLLWMA